MPRTTSKPLCLNCGVSLRYNRGASFCSAPACKRAKDRAYKDRLRAVAAVAPATKRCGGCDEEKPAEAFWAMTGSRDGLQSRCKPCNLASSRDAYLRRTYGISQAQYDGMLERQRGVCAIRSRLDDAFVVDHDHQSGAVRGLLCNDCNRGLGLLGDDVDRLVNATMYLLQTHDALKAVA